MAKILKVLPPSTVNRQPSTVNRFMNLTILSPEKEIFSGAVKSVKVPGSAGQFEMLENHAPVVSSLGKGEVRVIKDNGDRITFRVEGGFVEMLNNEVSLLVSGVKAD